MRACLTEPDPVSTTNPQGRRGISLTQATSVQMRMRARNGTVKTCPATPDADQTSPPSGEAHKTGRGWVTVDPSLAAGFTALKGLFDAEFLITWSGGGTQRVPNDGWFKVEIEDAV